MVRKCIAGVMQSILKLRQQRSALVEIARQSTVTRSCLSFHSYVHSCCRTKEWEHLRIYSALEYPVTVCGHRVGAIFVPASSNNVRGMHEKRRQIITRPLEIYNLMSIQITVARQPSSRSFHLFRFHPFFFRFHPFSRFATTVVLSLLLCCCQHLYKEGVNLFLDLVVQPF